MTAFSFLPSLFFSRFFLFFFVLPVGLTRAALLVVFIQVSSHLMLLFCWAYSILFIISLLLFLVCRLYFPCVLFSWIFALPCHLPFPSFSLVIPHLLVLTCVPVSTTMSVVLGCCRLDQTKLCSKGLFSNVVGLPHVLLDLGWPVLFYPSRHSQSGRPRPAATQRCKNVSQTKTATAAHIRMSVILGSSINSPLLYFVFT